MKKFTPVLLFFMILLLPLQVQASESRPNDSTTAAVFFGDIEKDLPRNLTPPPAWTPGMRKAFKVMDIASGQVFDVTADLVLVTEDMVIWMETGQMSGLPAEIAAALQEFNTETLPKIRETFGDEPNPGVDNDPRFHILFSPRIGLGYNGYFSAENNADKRVNPSSNAMDILVLNSSLVFQGADAVIDTLSHELQHMIHNSQDPNEMSFIDEGLAGLSEYLALGRIQDSFIRDYLYDTGRSLIWWPDGSSSRPYYGSSFLFSVYLYDRFGAELIRELVRQPENGMNGLSAALQARQISLNADDVFLQWSAALLGLLEEKTLPDWDYPSYRLPRDGIYRDIDVPACGASERHEIPQYGLNFFRVNCGRPFSITVSGNTESPVTGLVIPGGNNAWWGGAVSNSMALLRREFDLTAVSGPVEFSYDVNYAIEKGFDYYYLLLRDQNEQVTRLFPSGVESAGPAGQNRGGGVTGNSSGVRRETIDLSPWAGEKIELDFVYLTDTAGLGDGVLLDNFSIPAIGFFDDAETDDNGWIAEGFSRIRASVPQRFALVLLYPDVRGETTAEYHIFEGGEPFTLQCPAVQCAFAVTALNPDVRGRAAYTVATLH